MEEKSEKLIWILITPLEEDVTHEDLLTHFSGIPFQKCLISEEQEDLCHFGFLGYEKQEDALKAVELLNESTIPNQKSCINLAIFGDEPPTGIKFKEFDIDSQSKVEIKHIEKKDEKKNIAEEKTGNPKPPFEISNEDLQRLVSGIDTSSHQKSPRKRNKYPKKFSYQYQKPNFPSSSSSLRQEEASSVGSPVSKEEKLEKIGKLITSLQEEFESFKKSGGEQQKDEISTLFQVYSSKMSGLKEKHAKFLEEASDLKESNEALSKTFKKTKILRLETGIMEIIDNLTQKMKKELATYSFSEKINENLEKGSFPIEIQVSPKKKEFSKEQQQFPRKKNSKQFKIRKFQEVSSEKKESVVQEPEELKQKVQKVKFAKFSKKSPVANRELCERLFDLCLKHGAKHEIPEMDQFELFKTEESEENDFALEFYKRIEKKEGKNAENFISLKKFDVRPSNFEKIEQEILISLSAPNSLAIPKLTNFFVTDRATEEILSNPDENSEEKLQSLKEVFNFYIKIPVESKNFFEWVAEEQSINVKNMKMNENEEGNSKIFNFPIKKKQSQIREALIQVLMVLRHLHNLEKPVIHGNLNFLTIFFSGIEKETLFVKGFGLENQKYLQEKAKSFGISLENFLPPEKSQDLDASFDIFSFGAFLFQIYCSPCYELSKFGISQFANEQISSLPSFEWTESQILQLVIDSRAGLCSSLTNEENLFISKLGDIIRYCCDPNPKNRPTASDVLRIL